MSWGDANTKEKLSLYSVNRRKMMQVQHDTVERYQL